MAKSPPSVADISAAWKFSYVVEFIESQLLRDFLWQLNFILLHLHSDPVSVRPKWLPIN
jgi:hypothetical protein